MGRWTKRAAALTAPELKGAVITNGYGLYNRCVRDVQAAFSSLPTSPSNTAAYVSKQGQRLPPYNALLQFFLPFQLSAQPWTIDLPGPSSLTGSITVPFTPSVPHVQSLTRFELGDQQDDRWFAVSRAYEGVNKAGFFLVHLPDMNGADGGPLLAPGVNYMSPVPAARATQFYYPTEGTPHPGGMQAFGHYLAIAAEPPSGTSFVDIYDFSGGFGAGVLLQRVSLFSTGFPVAPERVITAVAVTRLKDGRYLMFVLGKDGAHRGWFFVSRDPSLPSTWDPFDYFDGNNDATPGSFHEYQNVTFLTDCATADIYMVATGNTGLGLFSAGSNYADLFKLDSDPTVGVRMTSLPQHAFDPGTNGACTFRAAATAYAGKDNRLELFCHSYPQNTLQLGGGGVVVLANNDPYLRFAEYNHVGCLSTELACGAACCNQGASCLEGACCASGDVCGSTCCGGGNVCIDASQSLCCSAQAIVCGSVCCDVDKECVNGTCQAPPPPRRPRRPGPVDLTFRPVPCPPTVRRISTRVTAFAA